MVEFIAQSCTIGFINNNFYLGLNGFLDFGQVTKKIDVNTAGLINDEINSEFPGNYFENDAEKMHYSYGLGLRVVMNENFIVRCDYGVAANERDGDSGLYIGLNYLF